MSASAATETDQAMEMDGAKTTTEKMPEEETTAGASKESVNTEGAGEGKADATAATDAAAPATDAAAGVAPMKRSMSMWRSGWMVASFSGTLAFC